MDLDEARQFVISDVMQTDLRSVDMERVDNGIMWALNKAIDFTGCNATETDVTIAAAANTVDLTSELTKFGAICQFVSARIGTDVVSKTNFNELLRRQDASTVTGKPRLLAFQSAALGHLFPTADAEYTMKVLFCPHIKFKPGGDAITTLDFPDLFIRDVLLWGVGGFLKLGQRDTAAQVGLAEFNRRLREIRSKVNPNLGPGFKPRLADRRGGYLD